jgi:hypothetical protein
MQLVILIGTIVQEAEPNCTVLPEVVRLETELCSDHLTGGISQELVA